MAQHSRGNTAPLGQNGGAAAAGEGPPPSTLAAQLVENISTSSKSSRSDESNELKGLFATIQRVKDQPELLKSHADRVEHNHMLIYVYCRVALEGVKLDDPFVNRAHVHAEALKAINFLRFTIKETPSVLSHTHTSKTLLHRGTEPLWVWLFPHLLRFLGHALFQELEGSLEGFLQYLLLLVTRTDELWSNGPDLILYLRACVSSLIDHLQDPSLDPSELKSFTSIHLPSQLALRQILGEHSMGHGPTYQISSSSQAIRQIASLAKVLAYPLIQPDSTFSSLSSLSQTVPWLLDTWLDLRYAQKRWDIADSSSPIPIIETVLNVSRGLENGSDMTATFKDKSHALLVLLCSEMVSCPEALLQEDETGDTSRQLYCQALLAISGATLESYSIGRMAASKLVQELTLLSSQHMSIGEGTDIWVRGAISRPKKSHLR